MHYAGTAVIEAHGPRDVRKAIAAGQHLTTLAFSEAGSRSHFWAPLSTATARRQRPGPARRAKELGHLRRPGRQLRLVQPAAGGRGRQHDLAGACQRRRACASGAVQWAGPARQRLQPRSPPRASLFRTAAMLGPDGGGFDIMMGIVLPYFQLMNAAGSRRHDGGRHDQGRRARGRHQARAPGQLAGRPAHHPRLHRAHAHQDRYGARAAARYARRAGERPRRRDAARAGGQGRGRRDRPPR